MGSHEYEDALQRIVAETQDVKRKNDIVQEEIQHTQKLISGFPEDIIIETAKLYDLGKQELFQALLRLLQRSKLESSRIEEMKERIRRRNNELIVSNDISRQLLELQQANQAQQAFQASLMSKIAENRTYKPAVKRQERAIVALENLLQLLQTQPDAVSGQQQPSPLFTLLEEDNKRLQRLIAGDITDEEDEGVDDTRSDSSRADSTSRANASTGTTRRAITSGSGREASTLLEAPQTQQRHKGQHGSSGSDDDDGGDGVDDADPQEEIAALEREVLELEQTLTETARKQAEEVARLEMRVMEAEFTQDSDAMSLASIATAIRSLRPKSINSTTPTGATDA
ncbi:hypothetical protein PTSG_02442 [Salpingoeca rosetta]|uniref:Uncharacterized protein n=1 Tax=Salpingoeca rosetta (strain ATCC 50818 / BSB-021) TaxID=946362 RepID=F2U279_SALR5|nr:uncharacterized protein PTSG_02442 [Salpingoeca rosetta]EGD81731.1 hypothetical protein PTSG_02442 [Salpingoeca rosetta]|eukprot:XP_004996935.1 hypothetical protein PTSG_02442 [Salpingoeca rosetta]